MNTLNLDRIVIIKRNVRMATYFDKDRISVLEHVSRVSQV